MTIISTTVGRNPSEEMEWSSWSTEESKMQYLDAISKTTEWSLRFQGKPFNITVIQVYAPTSNTEDWSWTVLWRPTRPFRANTQKRCPFHYRGLECKSRKSRNTWSNRQIWPWNTEWSWTKTNRVLLRKCTGHNKHPLPITQEKTLYINTEIRLIIFFAAKDGEALYSQRKQDRELTVAQTMNSLLPNSDLNWRK